MDSTDRNTTPATDPAQSASNRHYGPLNERGAQRAALLRSRGFHYRPLTVEPTTGRIARPGTIAVWTRDYLGNVDVVSQAELLHSDEFCWQDRLADLGILPWELAPSRNPNHPLRQGVPLPAGYYIAYSVQPPTEHSPLPGI